MQCGHGMAPSSDRDSRQGNLQELATVCRSRAAPSELVAQGSEHRSLDSTGVNPTASDRVPAA
eukprot:7385247-Prymnesium_polylepis.2